MNIVVFGAGAIGSLFGAYFSKKHRVILIGRASQVNAIKKHGLKITGKTRIIVTLPVEKSVSHILFTPDLLILTVKSYDTESAIAQAKKIITKNTIVLSLQNGLDNIEKIINVIDQKQVIAGITTHGAYLFEPGIIQHTGEGGTVLGEVDKSLGARRVRYIAAAFNMVGLETSVSKDIWKDIWMKAIINSGINPATTIFQCKNGNILKNPILEEIVKRICEESTSVANSQGINISSQKMIDRTVAVIQKTAENYSSMLQSVNRGKKTEIDSINGKIIEMGMVKHIATPLNEILVSIVTSLGKT